LWKRVIQMGFDRGRKRVRCRSNLPKLEEAMPIFRVALEGRNFWLVVNGAIKRLGFNTTRFVQAADESQAESRALDQLRSDPKLHNTHNDRTDPPEVFIEDIEEVDAAEKVPGGYAFFPDEKEPDA
jgi:hypothetical protein